MKTAAKNTKLISILIAIITFAALVNSYRAYGEISFLSYNPQNNYTRFGISSDKTLDSIFVSEKISIDIPDEAAREGKVMYVWATGYSSDPTQTDSTPFITASGVHVYDGVVAANFLPFGTKIRIPDIYGDKVFTVEDRMNPRYNNKKIIDIWFAKTSDAKNFGKRYIKIEIL